MRLLSRVLQPSIVAPREAAVGRKNADNLSKSHRLCMECGLVRSGGPGLPVLLPLAMRAVHKLERLVKECFESAGGQRVSVPALVPAALWASSRRLPTPTSGPTRTSGELFTLTDRHRKEYLLAPTFEESIAELMRDVGPVSHRQLPLMLYQMGIKYRDERRYKHGLLRSRAFNMADMYGLHTTDRCAALSYSTSTQQYRTLFQRLQLTVHRVRASSGSMGGAESHEWQLPAAVGEDLTHVCPSCSHTWLAEGMGAEAERDSECSQCGTRVKPVHSIEVGHTFMLGTTYSVPLGASYITTSGAQSPIYMTCYGIGITRLLAGALEALSSDEALVWPVAIAPYTSILITPQERSKVHQSVPCDAVQRVHDAVRHSDADADVIVDDRNQLTLGKRLQLATKMGYPQIIVMGRGLLDAVPTLELWRSRLLDPHHSDSSHAADSSEANTGQYSVRHVTVHQLADISAGTHTPSEQLRGET